MDFSLLPRLLAVFARQHKETGIPGLIGALLLFWSVMALTVGLSLIYLLLLPWMAGLFVAGVQTMNVPTVYAVFFPSSDGILVTGTLLFSLVSYRAHVFSRYGILLFLAFSLGSFVLSLLDAPYSLVQGAYMLGLVFLGFELINSAKTVTMPAQPEVALPTDTIPGAGE